jgi:hypothetical protein
VRTRANRLGSGVVAVLGVIGAGAASAQVELPPANPQPGNPYYIGVSEAYTRETNVFRAPLGQPEASDTYWTTSLLGGIDQPL